MSNLDPDDSQELRDIVKHSADAAEELYPKRVFNLRGKIAILIVAIVLIGSTVLTIIDNSILSQQRDCLKAQTAQISAIRAQNSDANARNSAATQNWINTITKLIDSKGVTLAQFDQVTKNYNDQINAGNAAIQAGNAAILKAQGTSCS